MLHKGIACSLMLLLAFAPAARAQSPGWSVALEPGHPRADDMYSVHFLTRHFGWAVGAAIYHVTLRYPLSLVPPEDP